MQMTSGVHLQSDSSFCDIKLPLLACDVRFFQGKIMVQLLQLIMLSPDYLFCQHLPSAPHPYVWGLLLALDLWQVQFKLPDLRGSLSCAVQDVSHIKFPLDTSPAGDLWVIYNDKMWAVSHHNSQLELKLVMVVGSPCRWDCTVFAPGQPGFS